MRWRWLRRGLSALLLLLLLGAAWRGTDWYRVRDLVLSEEPPRRAARLALPARDSSLSVDLRVSFDLLRQAVEQRLPASFSHAGEGEDTRYDFTLRRTTPVAFSEAGGRLRASFGVDARGTAGLRGWLADTVGLGRKNFQAAARVQADLGLRLDQGWCPHVAMDIAYDWTEAPRLEVIGGVWMGVEGQLRTAVDAALRELPAQLHGLIPCERVRAEVAQLWRRQEIPLQLPAAPPLFVQIEPVSLGTPGLVVAADHLRLPLSLRARTAVTDTAQKAAPAPPLPPLRDLPPEASRLRLAIPVRAGYDMVRDWMMREFGGRDYPLDVAGWTVRLQIRDIFLYPSDPGLALAVRFSARTPGGWLDTSGRVIFWARPVLEQGGTRLRLTELRFARELDNLVWSIASAAFEERIRARLSELAVYDFAPLMAEGLARLRRSLDDPALTAGLRLEVARPRLRLERIVAEEDALTVLGAAEAEVAAELAILPEGG
ncbi:DUF4403 family protein [Roseomonas sp. KE0001]|uniref:DUF4403 family protein n=1 Tax=Roseomonas sp. KE0001 TaxID=2479201 RepID=UPI0018DFB851|nr:DUF4403 family protein [Roseomonas sp. KE0001]MBI0434673.1 DUF4403 family protein [Roseomonas sp. KE0001]